MAHIFNWATAYNQPLNNWDVSKVVHMNNAFQNAQNFNQPLDKWDTSACQNMGHMFAGAESFHQSLNSWDVHNVLWLDNMFKEATSFNFPLDSWNLSNALISTASMFSGASSYNQSVCTWETMVNISVTDTSDMFSGSNCIIQLDPGSTTSNSWCHPCS
jgi:hypothetical protein